MLLITEGAGYIETVDALIKLENVQFLKSNLRNIIKNIFSSYKINSIIQFAAFALVEESIQNYSRYYINNVYDIVNLLNTIIKYNVKKIVFSSTCVTYSESKYSIIYKNYVQNTINTYTYFKLLVEGNCIKSIRLIYFNVPAYNEKVKIGEWYEADTHLIPNIIKSAINESKIFNISGLGYNKKNCTYVRDCVKMLDLAEAYRLVYECLLKDNKIDIFNLGISNDYSVKNIFDFCEKVKEKKISVEIEEIMFVEPIKLYVNMIKSKTILKMEPEMTLKESMKANYLWKKSKEAKNAY